MRKHQQTEKQPITNPAQLVFHFRQFGVPMLTAFLNPGKLFAHLRWVEEFSLLEDGMLRSATHFFHPVAHVQHHGCLSPTHLIQHLFL